MAFPAVCAAAAIGMCVHLPPSDTLDLAKDTGGEWIRIDFNWDIAEPSAGTYDWTVFDNLLDAAKARGLLVFATVGYGAAWASTGDTKNDGASNDVPNAAAYKTFVKAAAARYADGRVAAWGTWNEPNLEQFFEGTVQQWIDSAFVPGIEGIKEGCPSCLVVGPELATVGSEYATYLEAALAAKGPDSRRGELAHLRTVSRRRLPGGTHEGQLLQQAGSPPRDQHRRRPGVRGSPQCARGAAGEGLRESSGVDYRDRARGRRSAARPSSKRSASTSSTSLPRCRAASGGKRHSFTSSVKSIPTGCGRTSIGGSLFGWRIRIRRSQTTFRRSRPSTISRPAS